MSSRIPISFTNRIGQEKTFPHSLVALITEEIHQVSQNVDGKERCQFHRRQIYWINPKTEFLTLANTYKILPNRTCLNWQYSIIPAKQENIISRTSENEPHPRLHTSSSPPDSRAKSTCCLGSCAGDNTLAIKSLSKPVRYKCDDPDEQQLWLRWQGGETRQKHNQQLGAAGATTWSWLLDFIGGNNWVVNLTFTIASAAAGSGPPSGKTYPTKRRVSTAA